MNKNTADPIKIPIVINTSFIQYATADFQAFQEPELLPFDVVIFV
jgi:hypothetical protein